MAANKSLNDLSVDDILGMLPSFRASASAAKVIIDTKREKGVKVGKVNSATRRRKHPRSGPVHQA